MNPTDSIFLPGPMYNPKFPKLCQSLSATCKHTHLVFFSELFVQPLRQKRGRILSHPWDVKIKSPWVFVAPFVCPKSMKVSDTSTATHSYRREREESLPQSQKPLKLQQLLGDTTEEVTVSSLLNLGTRNSLEFKLSAPGQEFIAKLP